MRLSSLAEYRIKAGLTQEQTAEILDIATSTYNQYETGKRNIPAEAVDKLKKVLSIEDGEIFLPSRFTVSK